MIAPDLNRLCEQAKIYYYDFLFQKDKSEIPEQVKNHFSQCQNCQKEIYELKTAITQAEFKSQHNRANSVSPLSNILKLHFSYVDQDITCKIVKSFLPGLLDASMQISIPTPITTHLDHCSECVKDLEKIRDLNLSELYLYRLSRLFTAKSDDDNNISCTSAKSDMMAFVMMAFHESDEQSLKHLCTCKECRTSIYQYRETIRVEFLREKGEKPCFLSSKLSNDDVFDYTIPYGLDIERYRKSEFQQSRTTHIRRCPFCLEKIQELHRTVYCIAERPDSEIVTRYNVENSEQTVSIDDSENLYAGYPVRVEVGGASREAAALSAGSIINFTAALKRKILNSNFKSIPRGGIAGLLIVAVLLTSMLFYSTNAKGLTLAQLHNVFKRINNVHITSYIYTTGSDKPYQEQWILRSEEKYISESDGEFVLSDIIGKTQTTIRPGTEATKNKMSEELINDIKRKINGSIELLYNFPAGSEWNKIETEPQSINDGTEIYELIWTPEHSIGPELNKLRFFIKSDINLPVRVELYRKQAGESKFLPETYKTIEYLNDEEISEIRSKFSIE